MELSKEKQLVALGKTSTPSMELLKSHGDMLRSQIEDLQRVLAVQCELTGANPLSQEMAAGALSVKIGKRPRDLMNPKALQYMQSLFSIKDAISKKETREISAHFGVTVTQIRDFFTGQRSRVRKFIRLCREKADKPVANDPVHNRVASTSDPSSMAEDVVPLNIMAPAEVEGPSCSSLNQIMSGIEESERYFMENIFLLMRKEESFSGQVKLLEWILRVNNRSVLTWFLHKGGVMILATWLIQAATEEQTSVLDVLLKVLQHLPLQKDLPVHVSAILQSVNGIRFYRTSDISQRARALLAKWSSMFQSRSPSKSSGDTQAEMLLKQSIEEVMGDESWDAKDFQSEEALRFLCDDPGDHRKSETAEPLKLLTASGDDSSKKRDTRERRKVQMVEQPGQRMAVRNPQAAKSAPAIQSRPLSADDIQKAKMRLQFMQSKYGKTFANSDDRVKPESQNRVSSSQASEDRVKPVSHIRGSSSQASDVRVKTVSRGSSLHTSDDGVKPESQNRGSSSLANDDRVKPEIQNISSSQASISESVPKSNIQPERKDRRKSDLAFVKVDDPQDTPLDIEEPPWKKYKRVQILWQTPPEVKINDAWCVGVGGNSKEVEVQKNRMRRERETIYRSVQEIPSDPREPWDQEMEYDDSLTPEIPIEQLPDVEPLETPKISNNETKQNVAPTASTSTGSMPEPDLELLAELLKNPGLVFALTSGKVGDLSSQDTVKLLDMIKANGVSALGSLARLGGNIENKVKVSLPSPTPSSDPVPSGYKPDLSKNPFSRQHPTVSSNAYQAPGAAAMSARPVETLAANTLVHPQLRAAPAFAPQPMAVVQQMGPTVVPRTQLAEQWQAPINPTMHHQNSRLNNTVHHHSTPQTMQNINVIHNSNLGLGNPKPSPPVSMVMQQQAQAQLHAYPPQFPYMQEPMVPNPYRMRHGQGVEQIYPYQNNPNVNNYNGYGGGNFPTAGPPGAWGGQTSLPERPEYDSWSPDNSPSRRHEYRRGPNHHEARMNVRHGYGPESSGHGYHDRFMGGVGNKRMRDNGRWN